MQTTPDISSVKLRDAAIGSVLRVVGYEPIARDYKRKLLAMGLTPGTELRVTRHAPLGDPTEIMVGFGNKTWKFQCAGNGAIGLWDGCAFTHRRWGATCRAGCVRSGDSPQPGLCGSLPNCKSLV